MESAEIGGIIDTDETDDISGITDITETTDITQTGQPSDESIRSHIYQFLQANPEVDQREVRATVKGGVVTLEGTVDAVPEKRRAREIAETTPGVRSVVDNLQVSNFVEISDEALHSAIINQLSRDAFVESLPNLEIYVNNGEVRLEGTCKTWHERHAIADTVWWTPGVRNVEVLIHPTEEAQDYAEGRTAFRNEESL